MNFTIIAGLIALSWVSLASAQYNNGSISGRILDTSGAAVPKATVTITRWQTQLTRTSDSLAAGQYAFPLLPPGTYDIRVEHAGFKKEVREGVTVAAGDLLRVDLTLTPGDLSQSIEVKADAALANTESSGLGFIETSGQVELLPLNSRSFSQLLGLGTGIVPGADIYLCDCQQPPRTVQLLVKTTTDPNALAAAIRGEIAALSKSAVAHSATTMDEMISGSMAERLAVFLLGCFATAALILVSMGIYAELTYFVTQRTREIGIRIAIGASKRDIAFQVAGKGARLALAGIGVGVALAATMSGLLRTLLFDLSPYDAGIFLGVPLLLMCITAFAVLVPAWKATRLDPIRALRTQ